MRTLALFLLLAFTLNAHAPITPAIVGPLETRGSLLVDTGTGATVLLNGVAVDEANAVNFGVIRVRWNMNSVRLPLSFAAWRQDGDKYVDRVAADVRTANEAGLLVILAAYEPEGNGMPADDAAAFWTALATRLADNPRVLFSIFNEPSRQSAPNPGAPWSFWHTSMQTLVDAIRATGAKQLIAASAFHDARGFQGIGAGDMLQGGNIIYEAHPSFTFGVTNATRDTIFGAVSSRAPVYAGDWGLGSDCAGVSRDARVATDTLLQALSYFDSKSVSWSASPFRPGGLVANFTDFNPTTLSGTITCTENSGMGEVVLLWMTGDPDGFGVLRTDFIGNSAGGFAGPIAPGELVTLYAEQLGPAAGVQAQLTSDGKLPVNLEGAEVRFDGVPVPLLYAGAYQFNVQAPYELEPGSKTTVQVFYRGIPSNRLAVDVVEAAPELFEDFSTRYVLALNEDGSRNGPSRPGRPGGIIVLYASGGGQTSPAGKTGVPASAPHPQLTQSVGVTVDGRAAEVLFAGEVPGNVGLLQVNAKLPSSLPGALRPAPVFLRVGSRSSRAPVLVWLSQ